MSEVTAAQGSVITSESRKLKRELTLLPLFALIYFTVCGGSFGAEGLIGNSGPGLALVLLAITPIFFSIPNMLMVREMTSMMPAEGGYYHWVKQAFGPLPGFMAGWMNWVVSWVDVSIYPVLAAKYLSYWFAPLRDGAVIFGVQVEAWILQWLVALVLIWLISALNVRGARTAGIFTNWLGILMVIPLIMMSVVGFYNMIVHGVSAQLPFLPQSGFSFSSLTTAVSTGLFIVMWNYMGWELPAAAGDEIVNPKRTYPLAMLLVLIAAIATYAIPTTAGLYGGAGDDGRYLLWGQEEATDGEGIGATLAEYGVTDQQFETWGVDPSSAVGWEFPQVAHAIGEKASGQKNSPLANFLGSTVMFAAVLSMIGLFIGNGLGGTRVPFALAQDGMMPKFMVKVHPKYGTPWVAIVFCGVLFSIFSLQTFEKLVVVDVFLNMLVLIMEIFALWRLRFTRPELPRTKVPGGYFGLVLITLGPLFFVVFSIYSQIMEEGLNALWLALAAMALGVVVFFAMRKFIKPGIPDVDPYSLEPAED